MHSDGDNKDPREKAPDSVGYLLFDSLVHHLIEKGVLTKNDALSVVQTAAQVVRSQMHADQSLQDGTILSLLERTYSSFEAMPDRPGAVKQGGHNVHVLRPPLHGEQPQFPSDD